MGDPRYLMGTQKPAAQTAATADDPLLTLLQRFEAELAAFNEATATRPMEFALSRARSICCACAAIMSALPPIADISVQTDAAARTER